MAGRPLTMAREVTCLHVRFEKLAQELDDLIPEQYRRTEERPEMPNDPLGQLWRVADDEVSDAMLTLESLADELQKKARLREKGKEAWNGFWRSVDQAVAGQSDGDDDGDA